MPYGWPRPVFKFAEPCSRTILKCVNKYITLVWKWGSCDMEIVSDFANCYKNNFADKLEIISDILCDAYAVLWQ